MENRTMQYEKTMDLKQLLISALRKWRWCIIAVLAGGLLLGALDAVSQLTDEVSGFAVGDLIAKIVLGFILGVMAFCLCVFAFEFIKTLFNKNFANVTPIIDQFNIPILASFYVPSSEKTEKAGRLDKAIDKFAGVGRVIDEDKEYKVAAAKLSVISSAKKILIVGTSDEQVRSEVAASLKGSSMLEDRELAVATDILNDPNEIAKIKDSAVLIVESEKNTNEKSFAALMQFLIQSKAEIIGAVIK